jgi:hypothetical protein
MSTHGKCEHCEESFTYELWHTGFSDAAYAYCEKCGCVAMVDAWTAPKGEPKGFGRVLLVFYPFSQIRTPPPSAPTAASASFVKFCA